MVLFDRETEGCVQDTVTVKQTELAEGFLTAEIPGQMGFMEEWQKDVFYPCEGRPETILSDTEGNIQMTFCMLDKKLTPDEAGNAAEAVRSCAEQEYPYNRITPVHLFGSGEVLVGWFLMTLPDDGKCLCHVKAVFSVHERFCLATVTYPEEEREKWEAVVRHFFRTLHVKEKENETGKG